MAEAHKWYKRAHWLRLRKMVLAKDPICVICERAASTVADHKKPFRTGRTEQEQWELFCDLENNLQGVCKPCHDRRTAEECGGFGHAPKPESNLQHIARTGESGRQFSSSSFSDQKLDAKLADGLDDLLAGL